MKKIIVSFIIFLNVYANEAGIYNVNMDKKVYYDANKDKNNILKNMAKNLGKFINSNVSEKTYQQYKNGKIKLSQEELELQSPNINNVKQKELKKPGFFARMLAKIGIGSTKKISKTTITKPQKEVK